MLSNSFRTIFYAGTSMAPALKAGDVIKVTPYSNRKIRCGDVIVFFVREREKNIIHRVVSIDKQGIKTKGDNSKFIDTWVLSHDNIIGQAIAAQRGNKYILLYGGLRGRWLAIQTRLFCLFKLRIFSLFSPIYHWLAQSDIFKQLLSLQEKIKVISFKRPKGDELQLLFGHRVIGRYLPQEKNWRIKRPLRLFIPKYLLKNI